MPAAPERAQLTRMPLRQTLGFGAASYAALAINFAQGFALARILGPYRYGIWMELQLLLSYGSNYQLGVVDSVQRQLPLMAGQGHAERGRGYAAAGVGLLVLLTLGWLLLGSGAALLLYPGHRAGALAFVLATVLEVWGSLALALLKVESRFLTVGWITLARAAVYAGLIVLATRWGLPGAYARQVFIAGLALLAAWLCLPLRPGLRLDAHTSRHLLSDGLPLLAVGFVVSIQATLDRALVAALLGPAALGRYALAAVMLSVVQILPGVVAQTSYPRMLQQFGQSGDPAALRPQVLRRTAAVLSLASVGALAIALLLPPFTRLVLPRFTDGIPAARWILPGVVLMSSSLPLSYFLQTVRRQRLHLMISLVALAAHFVLVRVAVGLGGGIREVSMATSASYVLYAGGLFGAFLWASRRRAGSISVKGTPPAGGRVDMN